MEEEEDEFPVPVLCGFFSNIQSSVLPATKRISREIHLLEFDVSGQRFKDSKSCSFFFSHCHLVAVYCVTVFFIEIRIQ